ncbi:MAG: hypothetical protein AAF483_30715, partial [Planctomycetota bacterium]
GRLSEFRMPGCVSRAFRLLLVKWKDENAYQWDSWEIPDASTDTFFAGQFSSTCSRATPARDGDRQ